MVLRHRRLQTATMAAETTMDKNGHRNRTTTWRLAPEAPTIRSPVGSGATKWVRAMDSYRVVAAFYQPRNEMALRVLGRLEGEALDEVDPILDEHGISYFDHDDGIQTIIDTLAPAWAEREFRKKTAAISMPTAKASPSSWTASSAWSRA